MTPYFFFLLGFASQTFYPVRELLDLYVADDGRIEAYVAPPHDDYKYCYRNFININPDTGELILAFNVARESLRIESHIMTSTLESGSDTWSSPTNATDQPPDYIQDNMIMWWDPIEKSMVMLYQQSSYVYWQSIDPTWDHDTDLDAYDQRLFKTVTDDMGETWSDPVQLLEGVENPHVHFQIIPSLEVDADGNPTHVLVPVHHLSEGVVDLNWQMVYRTERSLKPHGEWIAKNMTTTPDANLGFIQASIIRCPDGTLAAFLRDCNGWWVRRSYSDDDGATWADPIELPIPNPDSMSQAILLHSGNTLLIYNPQQSFTSEPAPGDRYSNSHHLVFALSEDYGMTWQHSIMIEYAYDGMFNYPVAIQDPTCDNILVTYSVMARMAKGCSMLEECTMKSAGTQQYIKFTVVNEEYIKDEFNWQLDTTDACTWQIPASIAEQLPVKVSLEDTEKAQSSQKTAKMVVITLACVLGVVLCGNIVWIFVACKRPSYVKFDSEAAIAQDTTQYDTTKGVQ